MSIYKLAIIILFILLVIILFMGIYIVNQKNNIIQYNTIKLPIGDPNIKIKKEDAKCNQYCNDNICNDYQNQKIKYDLCNECKKEGKCYDPNEGICKFCLDFRTCETLYGCDNNEPIDPINNFCNKCW